jgi:alkylation response protein AidB-like acyl-CoA dehydrogenase
MDFDFSDDQEQLRDAVRKWVDKGYTFDRRREITNAGGFDRAAYTELAELGLSGLYVSEAHGGMGMGPVEGMVVMEELGRGIVMEPIQQALIAGAVLEGYAPEALKSDWLPKIAGGEAIVVLAQQERKGRYNISKCDSQAQQQEGQWHITGTKSVVVVGDHADAFLVPAMAAGKLALFFGSQRRQGRKHRWLRYPRWRTRSRVNTEPNACQLGHFGWIDCLEPRHRHWHCQCVRRSGGRDGQNLGHYSGLHEHAKAVQHHHCHLPGPASPRG